MIFHGGNANAFTVGDIVQANGLVWVRQTAGGTYIGTQASATQGTVTGGPTVSQIGGTGSYYTWYNIDWPSSPDGWVADVGLIQAVLAAPTLTAIVQKCDGTTSGIVIQWSAVTGASNYEIYRNGVLIYTTVGAGLFWNTDGLTPGLSYSFQVKAKNGSTKSGFSNSLSTTAPSCSALAAPSLTSIIAKCNGTSPGIEIHWSAVAGASNYEIYRGGVLIYTTPDAGTGIWNYDLITGQTYSYQVKAKNGSATSDFSSSLSTTAPNCAAGTPTVQTLSATAVGPYSAILNGQIVNNGGSTILERRIEWAKSAGNWGTGTSGFDYGFFSDATTVFNVSGNTFSLSLTGFLSNTGYKYRVWARNSTGWSDVNQVNVVTFTTSSGQSAPTVQTLVPSLITANSARLNATVNANGANTSFYFEYGTTTAYGNVTTPGNTSASLSINFDLTGLAPNTTYHYHIVASNSGGTSYGGDVAFNTAIQSGPTLTLTAPNGGENWTAGTTRTVTWTTSGATSQISYYYGDYSLDGGASWYNSVFYASSSATAASWAIPSSAVSSQARVRIRVFNSSGAMIASQTSANNFTLSSGVGNPTAVPDASNLAPLSGELVSFSGTRSSGGAVGCAITSYSWNFGDGATGTGSNPSHVYTSASGSTSYPVTLTVTDCNAKTDTRSFTILVTGQALGNNPTQPKSTDPVNLATGNYIYDHVDLRLPGRGMPFEFKRYYNSKDTTGTGLPLGYGWTHSYNINLSINASNSAVITYGDGHRETYTTNGASGYVSEPGVFNSLTAAGGTFTLTAKDQKTFTFNSQGLLTSIADKNSNTIAFTYDGASLSVITDTVGRSINFSNDANGLLVQITDPLGRTVQFTYDAGMNLIGVSDLRSNLTQFGYDEYHQITNAIDPRGNTFVSMVYDQQRRVVSSQKDALQNPTSFDYDFVNRVTTVTDAYTNKSYTFYDDRLRVITTVDNLGNAENFEYDTNNNRIKVVDKLGYVTSYAYDAHGNVILKVDPLTNSTAISYDLKNNPTNRTDALSGVMLFQYDANGNLTNTLNALGKTSVVQYDSFGQPLILTDPNGNSTINTFDSSGNLTNVQDALGGSTVFTFDLAGRKITQCDALGRTNRFVYDSADNLVAFVNALGETNSFTYDSNNNRVTATDFLGNMATNIYDQKDRLIIVRDPLGGSVTNEYDKLDRKVHVWDARGGLTQYGYDAVGNLVAITNAAQEITRYTYDANGNRTSITTPMGNVTTNFYDALNRLVASHDALGNSTASVFDPLGRRIQLIDPLTRTNYFNYDPLGRLVQFTDAAGGRVTNAYDNIGNRTASTDPNNHTTAYTFDALNRLVTTLEPAGGLSQYTYDAVGNVLSRTDANNQITIYQYDDNNRRTSITYPTGTPVTFGYDANGNRTNMTDSLGATTYSYDSLNRLTNVTDCYGKTVSYGYDKNGNRTTVTYPGNKTVTYVYDSKNRLTSVTDWLSHTTTYNYDLDGNLISTVNPNGTAASYRYGADNRLASLTNSGPSSAIISRYNYTLDAVGNHTQEEQVEPLLTAPVAGQFSYIYDNDNRMINWAGQSQGFDANGNMLSVSVTNLLSYDYENRLTQTVFAGSTSTYQYDGDGNRMDVNRAGLETRYILDRNSSLSQVLAETDSGGTITAYYVYGLGLISRIDSGGNARYYHFDSRGSTVALTDAAGQITDSYAYDPFGTPTAASGATDNRFRYLGRHGIVDEENGLNYIRARYYSARRGRFMTKDPTTGKDGDSQSLNRYIYALNNPVRLVDISGLSSQEASRGTLQLATSDNSQFHNNLISPETEGLANDSAGYQNQVASVGSLGSSAWNLTKAIGSFIFNNLADLFKLTSNGLEGLGTSGSISPVSGLISMGITTLEESPELAKSAVLLQDAKQQQRALYVETQKALGIPYEDAFNLFSSHFFGANRDLFKQAWDSAP